jgi:hypothetical protein
VPIWSRLRRRTFAPRRPVLFPAQYPLAAVTALALILGLVAVIVAFRG